MEQLAALPRLGDGVGHVQAGHVLVGDLGVDPDPRRIVERLDSYNFV